MFDHATPIGEVIVASPTYYRLSAEFRGRAAHAGIRPEDGRSAILAAAHAIAAMPHGRLDEQTTANVGSIQGGVGSTNVVPERCRILAEARSLDPERVEAVVAQLIDAVHDGAAFGECDVDVVCEKLFEGYRQKASAPAVAAAEAALRACGYEPRRIATGGGSDANALEAQGFTCVNLANGTERNHERTSASASRSSRGCSTSRSRCSTSPLRSWPLHELPVRAPRGAQGVTRVRSSTSARAGSATRTARRSPASGWCTRVRSPSSPTTASRCGWCASRARPPASPTCSSCRPASSTRKGRPARGGQARARRGDRQGRRDWEHLKTYFTTAGFTNEQCHVYLATGLSDAPGRTVEGERIEIELRPLAALDAVIAEAVTRRRSIGLLMLRARLRARRLTRCRGSRARRAAAKRTRAVAVATPPLSAAAVRALLLDFLAYLEFERGLSRNTLEAYRSDLLQFGAWLGRTDRRRSGRPSRADELRRRARRRRRGPAARRAGHAAAQDRLPALLLPPPAPHGRARRPTPRPTCARRSRAASCRTCSPATRSPSCSRQPRGTEPAALRDRALLEMMYACGLRASEAIGSRSATSTWRPACCAPAGRAPRSGSCRSGRRPRARSRAYLQRGRPRLVGDRWEARLFVNQRGGGLTRQGLYKIVQRHAAPPGSPTR